MVEVETHVGLVVGIGEIVHPACGIRENIYYIGIYKVIQTAQFPVDGLADYVSVVINVSGVL